VAGFSADPETAQRLYQLVRAASLKEAREEELKRLVLETGDRHPAAWTVYERAGFSRCGPVLDYPDSEWSVFYEKSLAR